MPEGWDKRTDRDKLARQAVVLGGNGRGPDADTLLRAADPRCADKVGRRAGSPTHRTFALRVGSLNLFVDDLPRRRHFDLVSVQGKPGPDLRHFEKGFAVA